MEIVISIIGALSAVIVATVGALMAKKNSHVLQIRKLKEEHYISFFESLYNLIEDGGNPDNVKKYTLCCSKLLIIGDEKVIKALSAYNNASEELSIQEQRKLFTALVKTIRHDLKIHDKDFPIVSFKVPSK